MLSVKQVLVISILIIISSQLSLFAKDTKQSFFKFVSSPISEAKFYGITELGYYFSISESGESDQFEKGSSMLSGNVGGMYNLSNKFSVGGSFYINIFVSNTRLCFAPRLRYWINKNFSSDFQLGSTFTDFNYNLYSKSSYMISGSINYRSWLKVVTFVEKGSTYKNVWVLDPFGTNSYNVELIDRTNWYAGLKLSSYPGAIGLVAVPLFVFILVVTSYHD